MGRLHARVYSQMPQVELVGVYDASPDAAAAAADEYGCRAFGAADELLPRVKAVSIGVGVVLDMMIHDIDIVLSPAQSPVRDIQAVGVGVIGEHEDICNARLTFGNGCVANVTASRLALKTERKLRVFSSEAYVSVDYQKRYGVAVRRTGNLDAVRAAADKIRRGDVQDLSELNFADLVHVEELQISDTEPLRAQL